MSDPKTRFSQLSAEFLGDEDSYDDGTICGHGNPSCERCTDAWSTERRKLLGRIAHLEGLVRSVEGVFDGDCSTECPFCKYTRGYSDTRHIPDCPAFTPEGEIK